MVDYVSLTCPSCGGKLQVTNDLDRFACGFCGNELIVKRNGGVVSLAPVVDGLKQIQMGTDRTASELAIVRLEKQIAALSTELGQLRVQSKASLQTGMNQALGVLLLGVGVVYLASRMHALIPGLLFGGVLAALGVFLLMRNSLGGKPRQRELQILQSMDEKRREMAVHQENVRVR